MNDGFGMDELDVERADWLGRHLFVNVELALAMSCVRPARPGELGKPTTVIAVQGRRGMIALYWAPVLSKPEMLLSEARPSSRAREKPAHPRIVGVVDLERLAKLDPAAIGNRFGMWRGNSRDAKGPGERTDPERDAARDRLKGRER